MYYNNNFKKVGKQLTQFTINNQTFTIEFTNHAQKRLLERKIDKFQAMGSILLLGEKRITEYRDTNKDIFIMDKEHNFSIVITIEGNNIVVITLIDKCDCFVRSGTIAINL